MGDYELLSRLRPIVTTRRMLFVAKGAELVAAGYDEGRDDRRLRPLVRR